MNSAATGIKRFVLNTAAPARLESFYAAAFGFNPTASPDRTGRLCLGTSDIDLRQATGRPVPPDVPGWSPLFQHFALVVPDLGTAYQRLRSVEGWLPISTDGPQHLPESSGGVTAFKFRDPEGHPLELLAFPSGRIPEAWREPMRLHGPAETCLGIDHSAISITNTARSLAFYSQFGFVADGGSHNKGLEQERLDGLPGADVEVTALQASCRQPPHLELLAYRGPYDRLGDLAVGDVAATRLVIASQTVAPGLYRDPDGHVVEIEP